MSAGSRRLAQELSGIWRSRGYGWIIESSNGKCSAYDVTPGFCMKQKSGSWLLDDLGRTVEFFNGGQSVRLTMDESGYAYIFDRIDALPSGHLSTPSNDPFVVFDSLVGFFNTHYPFFSLREVDWQQNVNTCRSQLHPDMSDKDLFQLFERLLSPIGDGHVSLSARIWGKKHCFDAVSRNIARAKLAVSAASPPPSEAGYWTGWIGERLAGGTLKKGARKTIRYGLINDRIGLLSIRAMEGCGGRKAVARAMDRAIQAFEPCEAVIVDVSLNGGGLDVISSQIAGYFTPDRIVGYQKYAGDAAESAPQPIYIEPSKQPPFTGPVYVITSEETASAAEIFVMAMRALPNTVHVGQVTEGILSDTLDKRLPNGWEITLSNEIYLDSASSPWEDSGIPPHVPIVVRSGKKGKKRHQLAALRCIDRLLLNTPRNGLNT